ncbi:MAG: hypothetical protein ACRECO_00090 [Xanthobacteraceae bacterium]
MNHSPAEAAKRRSAAYWFSLVAALALTWAFQSVALGPAARAIGVHDFSPDWPVTRSAALYQDTQVLICSRRDLQQAAFEDQPSIDEPDDILIAPRAALSVAWKPGLVAGTACVDVRLGFTRIFNPRAPPPPQA